MSNFLKPNSSTNLYYELPANKLFDIDHTNITYIQTIGNDTQKITCPLNQCPFVESIHFVPVRSGVVIKHDVPEKPVNWWEMAIHVKSTTENKSLEEVMFGKTEQKKQSKRKKKRSYVH